MLIVARIDVSVSHSRLPRQLPTCLAYVHMYTIGHEEEDTCVA